MQYQPRPERIFTLGYYQLGEREKQTDITFQWPVTGRWTGYGKWQYSLEQERNLETLAGLEYRSCCWGLRLSSSRRLASDGDQITSLMLQLELTGLGKIGNTRNSPLQQGLFFDQP